MGYGIIAVPTGIFAAQFVKDNKTKISTQACEECSKEGHDIDAEFCNHCGSKLNP